ncbi:cation:proton antiporter [Proteiniclasticum sp. BAD-10]|uniref:Cation:proton antiporter n=1 Tax=Proteiniclasticum sediminis TaxID=2804028 RepID=A0A941CML9_9CLOT|nr:cation:proton antiporter [Proteiniclasticum sediminis]MBR0574862.1 cation:proton antiporter [Proteiniclasticum sediminis]
MLLSISLILMVGFALNGILGKLKIPGLVGLIFTGILLGPQMLNLISPKILAISTDLREIALVVILIRAGLSLDLRDLKKVGRPALLMSFVPATFEMAAVILLAPALLHITRGEAAILGAVLSAVSPAVVVPRMLSLMESGYGRKKRIPQLIMAGASVDDIYVIVLFTAFLSMYGGGGFQASRLLSVPVSVILGVVLGIVVGVIMVRIFQRLHIRDTVKVLILLSTAFLFLSLEDALAPQVPLSGLLAVMAMGATVLKRYEILAKRLVGKFSKIWVGAEVFLFVLVGAAVEISALAEVGIAPLLLILGALLFRTLGVYVSLLKTPLTAKERLFCAVAYLPKATVQAAIGSLPLAAGVAAGSTILTVAVLAILITAPGGAMGMDYLYPKLLTRQAG